MLRRFASITVVSGQRDSSRPLLTSAVLQKQSIMKNLPQILINHFGEDTEDNNWEHLVFTTVQAATEKCINRLQDRRRSYDLVARVPARRPSNGKSPQECITQYWAWGDAPAA